MALSRGQAILQMSLNKTAKLPAKIDKNENANQIPVVPNSCQIADKTKHAESIEVNEEDVLNYVLDYDDDVRDPEYTPPRNVYDSSDSNFDEP